MKHPMQNIHLDEQGVARFVENEIVRHILDHGGIDLNELAMSFHAAEHREDFEQFAQLIGYSVCGFADLSYASDEAVELADAEAEKLL